MNSKSLLHLWTWFWSATHQSTVDLQELLQVDILIFSSLYLFIFKILNDYDVISPMFLLIIDQRFWFLWFHQPVVPPVGQQGHQIHQVNFRFHPSDICGNQQNQSPEETASGFFRNQFWPPEQNQYHLTETQTLKPEHLRLHHLFTERFTGMLEVLDLWTEVLFHWDAQNLNLRTRTQHWPSHVPWKQAEATGELLR